MNTVLTREFIRMESPGSQKQIEQLQQRQQDPNALLNLGPYYAWKITQESSDNKDTRQANLIVWSEPDEESFDIPRSFKFRTSSTRPAQGEHTFPRLGQWFFIKSHGDTKALAWYICSEPHNSQNHLFSLVSAEMICQNINGKLLYNQANVLAKRTIDQTIEWTYQAPYDGPHLIDAERIVQQACRENLQANYPQKYAELLTKEAVAREKEAAVREKFLAFVMSNHSRLGSASNARTLPEEHIKQIWNRYEEQIKQIWKFD